MGITFSPMLFWPLQGWGIPAPAPSPPGFWPRGQPCGQPLDRPSLVCLTDYVTQKPLPANRPCGQHVPVVRDDAARSGRLPFNSGGGVVLLYGSLHFCLEIRKTPHNNAVFFVCVFLLTQVVMCWQKRCRPVAVAPQQFPQILRCREIAKAFWTVQKKLSKILPPSQPLRHNGFPF